MLNQIISWLLVIGALILTGFSVMTTNMTAIIVASMFICTAIIKIAIEETAKSQE